MVENEESKLTNLRKEIEKEITSRTAKVIIAVSFTLLGFAVAGWWLYLKDKIIDIAGGVPKGSVVAFDLDICPNNWTPFDLAQGRMIIGTGNNGGSNKDEKGNKLTVRNRRSEGGEETHVLSVSEIPSHDHSGVTAAGGSNAAHLDNRDSQNLPQGKGVIGKTGGSKAHNNMPPYIVLTYCMKQ